MSCPLAFVVSSSIVVANAVYLQGPEFILARDVRDNGDGGDGDGTSSTIISTTTTSSDKKHSITSSGPSSVGTSSSPMSSPSGSAQNNAVSASSQDLSTAARTGLSFGIMIFLILSAVLFCYIRRRSRKARENASYGSVLLSSEVRQYRPPDPVVSSERELSHPPQLDTAHPDSHDVSHSSSPSTILSRDPLLSDISRANSHSMPSWSHNSTSVADIPQIATQQRFTLPNPHDPFPTPSRFPSTMVSMTSSSPNLAPYGASTGSAAVTNAFGTLGDTGSSTSYPQRRLSALHADLARYQKELELDYRKRSDTREEPQEPPPRYSS